MRSVNGEEEPPPSVLGSWVQLYILEIVVLVVLVALFVGIGRYYQ